MNPDFVALINESKGLNASVFSLSRIQLLAVLTDLGQDGATFTELKIALDLTDGALYANVNALEEMGYLVSKKAALENKTVETYSITPEGRHQWEIVKNWLKKIADNGGNKK